ncbi:MAG: hypothetical protein SFX72_16845, partial [Isosphaeraceae bacterium]|nr:hypothetical protein [Isosphaeraceae bacterium]
MSFDPNDPRFTAYSLGELDEVERLAVEAELARDGEALAFVEGVRELASILSEELRRESAPALESDLTQVVERELIGDAVAGPATVAMRPRSGSRGSWAPWIGLAAGVVTLVGGFGLYLSQTREGVMGPLAILTDEAAPAAGAQPPPGSRPMGDAANLGFRTLVKSAEAPAPAAGVELSSPPAPAAMPAPESAVRGMRVAPSVAAPPARVEELSRLRGGVAPPPGQVVEKRFGMAPPSPAKPGDPAAVFHAPAETLAFKAKPSSPTAGGMMTPADRFGRGLDREGAAAGRRLEDRAGIAPAPAPVDAVQAATPPPVQLEAKLAEVEQREMLAKAPALPQIAPIVDNAFLPVVGNE